MEVINKNNPDFYHMGRAYSQYNILTTGEVLESIADYFKNNPGCISNQYYPEDQKRIDYAGLEKRLAKPEMWYEEVELFCLGSDPVGGDEICERRFILHDLEMLTEYEYAPESDAVYVLVTTQGDDILEVEVCCH